MEKQFKNVNQFLTQNWKLGILLFATLKSVLVYGLEFRFFFFNVEVYSLEVMPLSNTFIYLSPAE